VHPAYQFNIKPLILEGEFQQNNLLSIEADNILVEAIKPLENNDKGFVIRMYEAEGAHTITSWNLNISFDKIEITNMLEETLESLDSNMDIVFKPFEIKTIKVSY
jgi:alpha-mannosidase